MREGTAPLIRREDYTAPAFWIKSVDLTFDLDAAKTLVTSRMKLERNLAVPPQALKLHGEDLTVLRVLVNGESVSFRNEEGARDEVSWARLERDVAALAQWLREQGVQPGDRVVAYLPNIPQAVVAFLAVASVGAVWSLCSPEMGVAAVVDRFRQIEPKVMIAVDAY